MEHAGLLFVTGGSRGIGAAVARLAATQGWHVALCFHSDRAAATAVVESISRAGGVAAAYQLDVAEPDAVEAVFAKVDAQFGPSALRGLVNNAGIVGHPQPLAAMNDARLQRMFAVNVLGSMYCARAAIRRMSRRQGGGGGAIVNIGSVAARLGSPAQYVDYAASKGAIDTLTIGLAREVASDGIRVNAVRPGIIDTEIHASGGEPDRATRLVDQIPLRRAGTADEVARSVLFLLGPEASYTTGAIVDCSGGR